MSRIRGIVKRNVKQAMSYPSACVALRERDRSHALAKGGKYLLDMCNHQQIRYYL